MTYAPPPASASAARPPSSSRLRRELGIVLVLVAALVVPFSGRAFHIDDVYFIEVAQKILDDPLRPFAGAVALEDADYRVFAAAQRPPETFAAMSHPPIVPYAIALAARLSGGFAERPLHLAFAPFALAAAAAAYVLARRFTARPLGTALLVVSSPLFVLSAHSLMTDMPSLAFSLAALAAFVGGVDRGRKDWVVAAGFLAGLALCTRYSAVMILPVMALYGIARGQRRRSALALIGVGTVFGLWSAQNLIVHGRVHLLAAADHYRLFYRDQSFDWVGLVKKALADLAALGATGFAAVALLGTARPARELSAFLVGALGVVLVFAVHPPQLERLASYDLLEQAALATCVGLGLHALTAALATRPATAASRPGAPRDADHLLLRVWLALALAVAVVALPFGAARYMLPAWPPLCLLLSRRLVTSVPGEAAQRRRLALGIGQLLALACLLGLADAELADRYRDVAITARASHPSRAIWYVGEWGFRYYMDAAGGRYLRSDDQRPAPGDFIVRPLVAGMHELPAAVRARSRQIQDVALQGRWPIRLMSFEAHAGYYSHHWGFLPFAPSRAPLEHVEVFEVLLPPGADRGTSIQHTPSGDDREGR